jgi:4-hydroxythreonine-4-phosphate dehydrogenase
VIVVTPGDPAGIGPEVTAKALAARPPDEAVTVIGAASVADWLERYEVDVPLVVPSSAHEAVEVAAIREAVRRCLAGEARALVTGPIHKARLAGQGFRFPGHTDFLGELCGVPRPVMAFVGGRVRVALVTVHLPLREVAAALTEERVVDTVRVAHRALVHQLGLHEPKLLVCGLNPHAGDEGLLGREDLDVVAPAVERCRAEGIDAVGPVSAETAFRQALNGDGDMVVATYHDQGLAPLKALEALAGTGSVNWTLGLPIVRTSVDHGTADDIAGLGVADARSMMAAIDLAQQLARPAAGSLGS